MKKWFLKKCAENQEWVGGGCILCATVGMLMLIPFGWEMLAAFGFLTIGVIGFGVLDAHWQSAVISARMGGEK